MTHKVQVFIAMNEDGDYEMGGSADEACERLSENYGGMMVRVVRLDVSMSAPKVEFAGEVNVPNSAGSISDVSVSEEEGA